MATDFYVFYGIFDAHKTCKWAAETIAIEKAAAKQKQQVMQTNRKRKTHLQYTHW